MVDNNSDILKKHPEQLQQYEIFKDRQSKELSLKFNELINHISTYPEDRKNRLANQMYHLLSQKLVLINQRTLQREIDNERRGEAAEVEVFLKQILNLKGVNIFPPSLSTLQTWERLGMNPEGEDELANFLDDKGISELFKSESSALIPSPSPSKRSIP